MPVVASDIVGDHGVDFRADRRPMRRTTGVRGRDYAMVRLVDHRRHDEEGRHPPFHHRRDDLGFAIGAVPGRGRQDETVTAADHLLDAAQHTRPERVADVGRDDTDHRCGATRAQQSGELVRPEAELSAAHAGPERLCPAVRCPRCSAPGTRSWERLQRARRRRRPVASDECRSCGVLPRLSSERGAARRRAADGVAGHRVGDGRGGVGDSHR